MSTRQAVFQEVLAIAPLVLVASTLGAAVPAAAEQAGVEEIVVTARKRAELIQDTPIAVTALGPDRLEQSDITSIDDIRRLVPSLQFQQTPVGINSSAQFRIRGVGTTRVGTSFDPGIAVYVNGVYVSRGLASLMNLIDIESIEVLRGPQGTLFGKNTVGGAINVTSVRPKDELEGSVLVRPGNFDAVDNRLMLNVPITDTLFTRITAMTRNSDGYHTNTLRDEELGEQRNLAARLAARWLITDDISLDLAAQWSRNDRRGSADRCVVEEGGPAPLAGPGFLDACRRSRPFEGQHNVHELASQENYGVWAEFIWDIGDLSVFEDVSFKSITSWGEGSARVRGDIDGTELDVIQINIDDGPLDGGPGSGWGVLQEGVLSASALEGKLNLVGGVFFFRESNKNPQFTRATLNGLIQNGGLSTSKGDNTDWALFAQATGDVTDWLSVTAGVRYTEEEKKQSLLGERTLPAVLPPTLNEGKITFESWTPMASVALTMPEDWMDGTPLEHLMAYFTYSRGFRGGGFNVAANTIESGQSLAPFDPEKLDSFEIGLKTIAWDQRLSMNLAAFHYDYQDIQVLTTQLDAQQDIVQITNNAGKATGRGIELEMQFRPLENLIVNGSLAYIDTEYDRFEGAVDDVTNLTIDRSGESFNNTPELQTNLSVMMILPVQPGPEWLNGAVMPRVEWYYQSGEHYAGPELIAATQSGYNLLNARVTYRFMEGKASVALWAKNLTDREYFLNAQPLASTFGHVLRTYAPPRTFGAELIYRFGPGA